MSVERISDAELDLLLGHVPPPQRPSADLAERIVGRSLRTPQARVSLWPVPRRRGPRRRPPVWSALVLANVMAAAAAAASWDGERFDFHRLADLPQRVAAAVRIGHHRHQDHKSVQPREHPRPALQIASVSGRLIVPAPVPSIGHPELRRVVPSPILSRAKPQPVLHLHGKAQARFQREAAVVKPVRSIRAVANTAAERHPRSIMRTEPVERPEPNVVATERRQTEILRVESHPAEQPERNAIAAGQQPATATSEPVKALENARKGPEAMDGPGERQERLDRGRARHWRSQFFKRPHPRERGGRFRGRF